MERRSTCGEDQDFSESTNELASYVHSFDLSQRCWAKQPCSGPLPLGLCGAACASAGHLLYVYGGFDGSEYHDSLHQLDTKSLKWTQLSSSGPMKKDACGMVVYGRKLILFGGVNLQEQRYTDNLHTFDLTEGEKYI